MTHKLYYEDPMMMDFTARVVRTQGEFVELDQTAFYPGGGGQNIDTGTMDGLKVTDVTKEEERILHRVPGHCFTPGQWVKVSIDAEKRLDGMRQHSGQHLISGAIDRLMGGYTIGLHTGHELSSIDIRNMDIGYFPRQTLNEIEDMAQAMALLDLPIVTHYPMTPGELTALGVRKPTQLREGLRIVTMGDEEAVACGGVHLLRTGMIGPIRLVKAESHGNDTRIFFLCGPRATLHDRLSLEGMREACLIASCGPDGLAPYLYGQAEKIQAVTQRAASLEEALLPHLTKALDQDRMEVEGVAWACVSLDDGFSNDLARRLTLALCAPGKAAIIALPDANGALLQIACPDGGPHAGTLLKNIASALGGKGGGRPDLASGHIPTADFDQIKKALREVLYGI